MATVAEASKHIFIVDRRFRELMAAGVFERQAKGEHDLDDVRRRYILHLRAIASGRIGVDLALITGQPFVHATEDRETPENSTVKGATGQS
jgi:hypothetical protein